MRFSPPLLGLTPGLGTTTEMIKSVLKTMIVGANKIH